MVGAWNWLLQSVSVWKKDIDSKLQLPDGSRIPAVLLGRCLTTPHPLTLTFLLPVSLFGASAPPRSRHQ